MTEVIYHRKRQGFEQRRLMLSTAVKILRIRF